VHHLLDPGLCELRFRGWRSGLRVALPVLWAPAGDRLVVLIGDAPAKSWWRNFRSPGPIQVRRSGIIRAGVARVIAPGQDGYDDAARAYTKRHGLVPQPTDRLLVIEEKH
jgi:hypothetical protein